MVLLCIVGVIGAAIDFGTMHFLETSGANALISRAISYILGSLFAYYAKNDELRITDLHQGIIWGTNTPQTLRDERLVNRFDYDGDYGTVLNRFLIQAAIGYPLTVHGTGGQTRAFIHIQDSVRCVELALGDAPQAGERVRIFNQMTETHRVRDLGAAVPDVREPQAGGRVQVAVALGVEDVGALAAREDEGTVALHGAHVREAVPECR